MRVLSVRKIYDSKRWKQLRVIQLEREPLCFVCKMNDRVTPATDCHHSIPLEEDLSRAFDQSLFISVCKECHKKLQDEHEAMRREKAKRSRW